MRAKWTTVATMLAAGALLLTGCGKEIQNEEKTIEISVETVQELQSKGEGHISACKTVKHLDKAESVAVSMQEQYKGMMVQVIAGEYMGSGVIYREGEQCIWILTAAHVAESGKDAVSVVFQDGFAAPCSEVAISGNADVAFLKVNLEAFEEENSRLKSYSKAMISKDAYDDLANGDIVVAMGSTDGVAENAYEGTLEDPWIFVEDFNQYMMIARVYAHAGMSGGGLFDQNGYFLGILCGTGEDDHAAFVPVNLILSEEIGMGL